MAKRSPILGYNHNVRYRGLVFHVQTEDSGLLNPHLFTHLFHGGVIVSTRKLVYDSGANEEAIKSLMQAQHKAVMKDLRKGTFDDKIDQYLGGTEGLEPRGGRASTPVVDENAPIEIVTDGLSEPIELPMKRAQSDGAPVQARTQTGDKTTPVSAKVAAEVARAPTQLSRKPIPEEMPSRDSAPIIEMTVDDEDELAVQLRGAPRDTAVENVIAPPSHRPPSHGAATLPKAAHRTPTPPVVTTRIAGKKDEVQIHSPAPPSAEPPPGERSERPGQYSVNRKDSGAQLREKTGRIPALNPVSPVKRPTGGTPIVQPKQDSGAIRRVPNVPPQPARPPTPATGSRVPPGRVHATAPIANRTPSPPPPAPGSGVVMTRPAVIVGAPPKPAASQQRVRKAREDEGRGFGQGLISEKSLDEVILAYLSEDAEDK